MTRLRLLLALLAFVPFAAEAANLKVTLTVAGKDYVYTPEASTPYPNYQVSFHPDRINFHFGTFFSGAKPENIGKHHVKIEDDGKTLYDDDLIGHWWASDWNWRLKNPEIVRTPEQLFAARRVFKYGNMGIEPGKLGGYSCPKPMCASSITVYMPTTGERQDLGLITDASANFLRNNDPWPMVAWATAASSVNMHFRDERTGRPVSLIEYPKANNYWQAGAQGQPWMPNGPTPPHPDDWVPDTAHWPEMSYVAFQATHDFGYLEDLQYAANYTIFSDAAQSNEVNGARCGAIQLRQVAWCVRNICMAHIATVDAEAMGPLPDYLLPSSYWKQMLKNNVENLQTWVNDPTLQELRLLINQGNWAPWNADYMLTTLAFCLLTGHDELKDIYLWHLGNAIARTNGTSGWPPGYGTAYFVHGVTNKTLLAAGRAGSVSAADRMPGWAAMFDDLYQRGESGLTAAQYAALKADPLNGGKAITGHEYNFTLRAALVMADTLDKLGIAAVRKAYPDFDTSLKNINAMVAAHGHMNLRQSVVSP